MANTTTTKKVTKAQRFDDLKALLTGEQATYGTSIQDALEFIKAEKALLARKNTSKTTKRPMEEVNRKLAEQAIDFLMTVDHPVNSLEIYKNVPSYADFNGHKITSIMNVAVKDGTVVKTKNSKGVFYSLAN